MWETANFGLVYSASYTQELWKLYNLYTLFKSDITVVISKLHNHMPNFYKIVNKNTEEKECVKTHPLTPWNRVLEKLISSQLLKKFPAFYGTRQFITMFTKACHLSLS